MKLAVLDASNLLVILGSDVRREYVLMVQEHLKENLPGWNVLVFGGLNGEIFDLRDDPVISAKATELHGLVQKALEDLAAKVH